MTKLQLATAVAAISAASCLAVETRHWTQDSQAAYEKATLHRVSVRSDGRLAAAPKVDQLLDASTPYLWAVAVDSKGNRYAGGGGPGASTARLFVIDAAGKHRVLAELPGMEIHALAIDRRDRVYAATSPDGKIYRVASDGKNEVYYEPKAKYIWAMAFNRQGELFVATGDQGEIHRVGAGGKGEIFFRTEETHARSLALDTAGNLIVGTDPGGLILRVTPKGEGFVLHQSGKREVTAVAAAADGALYAAAVGARQPTLPVMTPAAPPPAPGPVPSPSPAPGPRPQATPVPPPSLMAGAPALTGGSEIWRIDREGFPRKVWSDAQEVVYSLTFDAQGRPLAGAGNQGRIYRLDSDLLSTRLISASASQVTALTTGPDGAVYAATGNVGLILRLGPEPAGDGAIESEPLDAGFFSYWGRLRVAADLNGGALALETRSGNLDRPQKNWSPWTTVALTGDVGRVQSPPARFLQWKLTLKGATEVRLVEIAYLARNVSPVIEEIEITPPNHRFPPQNLTLTPSRTLTLQPLGRQRRGAQAAVSLDAGANSMQYARGYLGVRWLSRDENGDGLTARVEIRGAREKEWKLLKDRLNSSYYSWDSTAFPDGEYRLRVTVSDAPDNPTGSELEARLESDAFVIDNTPPEILALSARGRVVTWKARDALNIIEKAEYSLDGGEWKPVLPLTRLSDATELDYSFTLENLAPGEHTIAVRVTDEYENHSVAKQLLP